MNITIEFFIFKLVYVPIFTLNWQLQFFWPNLPRKGSYFQSKTDKIDPTIEFCIFDRICIYGPNLPKKVFPVKHEKKKHHHWVSHIQISLGTKFQLKLIILSFGPNLPKKGISSWKQNKLCKYCVCFLCSKR